MSLDSIIAIAIIPLIFIWIGAKIYKHEKEHIDALIEKIKKAFTPKEDFDEGTSDEGTEYNIDYRGKEY